MMSIDDAVRTLRSDPAFAELVLDAYIEADVKEAADRFARSAEWKATEAMLSDWLGEPAVVVDLGSGTGIAAAAFARIGVRAIFAVEPDPSDEVGRGAIRRLELGEAVTVVDAFGDSLPLGSGSVDIVYARQVLHHVPDLRRLMTECARVLRPGGAFLAVREHVVEGHAELAAFLASHPIHQMAGGENAYAVDEYVEAIRGSGLSLLASYGPWDSIVNAFPTVRTEQELDDFGRSWLVSRLGASANIALKLPGVEQLIWRRIRRRTPGELHAFLAFKPDAERR